MRGFSADLHEVSRRAFRMVRRFAADEDGSILAYVIVMFVTMVIAAGSAVDFMRHEFVRAKLQDGLDRGVLAAASFRQSVAAQNTVQGYLSTIELPEQAAVTVTETMGPTARRVSAQASLQIRTFFLKIIGIPTMTVQAAGAAEESLQKLEISLILDISGSMARNNRMVNLKPAASDFIDEVLTPNTREYVSVSLVPFSGQVNPGSYFFNHFNSNRVHDYSSCLEFQPSDFNTTALTNAPNSLAQTPHFQWFYFEQPTAVWGWCPTDDMALIPFSNDNAVLKAKINSFHPHDGTGTQYGMKWGLALLDPGTQTHISTLSAQGAVPNIFSDRPAAWDDPESKKYIVIMTDGNVRYQRRPKSKYYRNSSHYSYWAQHYLGSHYSYQYTAEDDATNMFLDMCNMAKQNGVTIFTIGFEVAPEAANEMTQCATSPSHFYLVDGLDIHSAFQSIATTIHKLKLVN
ncbi:MAG: pilus assembly protein TadG-related protein [Paracoccaceae bacterium]